MHTFQAAGWKVSSVALPASASCVAACTALSTIGDITDKRVREIAVEKTLSAYGRIDVLINNAGVGLYAPATGVTRELFFRLIDVNVYAPLALAQLVLPLMRAQQSGSIVTIGSVAGSVALPWTAGYSASKAALHAIHDSLRREVRNTPVHLMKVAPGIVDTDFRAHVLVGEAPPAVQKIRRVVSAEEVARAILRGIRNRRKTVYVPRVGALFALMGNVAPGLMDRYLAHLTNPLSASHALAAQRSEKVS